MADDTAVKNWSLHVPTLQISHAAHNEKTYLVSMKERLDTYLMNTSDEWSTFWRLAWKWPPVGKSKKYIMIMFSIDIFWKKKKTLNATALG